MRSFGGESEFGGSKSNFLTLQPFVNYNSGDGWYAVSSPIITEDCLADSRHCLMPPVGGGFGKVFRLGK